MALEDHEHAQVYLDQIAGLMGLSDWVVKVKDEGTTGEDALCEVFCTPGRKLAGVWLSEHFFAADASEQRYGIVHELLHIHHAHGDHIAEKGIRDIGLGEAWQLANEYAIDAVATVLAPLLPEPA